MKAYHGEESVKAKYLARVRAHRAADQLVQGYGYWKEGRGCAVGCTIHGDDHEAYETELGIPRGVAALEDTLFERLPAAEAQAWPERFLASITPGADLTQVLDHWLLWLLLDPKDGVLKFATTEKSRQAIRQVGELYTRKIAGEKIKPEEWIQARSYAASASSAAYAAAAYANAYAVSASAAYYASASAAYANAYAADAAADAYANAYAANAAYAAYAAYASASADDAAADDAAAYASAAASADAVAVREKSYLVQADKLLELLRAAPMTN